MNLFTKQKWPPRHRKQTYGHQKGKGGGRDKLGIWDGYTRRYIKQINSKNTLYSTGSSIQYLVVTYDGKESEEHTHTYAYTHIYKESLWCVPEM